MHCPSKWTLAFCHAFQIANNTMFGSFLDIGAAFGYELKVARNYKYNAIGVECRFDEYNRLFNMFKGDEHVKLIHGCVSNVSGLTTLFRAQDSSSMHYKSINHIKWKTRRDIIKKEYVPKLTIDQIVSQLQTRIGFIKIDVQGHEFSVLEGAKNTVKQFRPYLFYECFSEFGCKNDEYIKNLNWKYNCKCKGDCFCIPN
jgi:FkbM family methyltransferase